MQIVCSRKGSNISPDKFKALMRNKARMQRRPTRGERRFKAALKSAGVKHVTQRIFVDAEANKGYIADFYSKPLYLVFEVDGDSHNSSFQRAYDDVRSSLLAKRGIKVARITNEQVKDRAATAQWIKEQVAERKAELIARQISYGQSKRDPREITSTSKTDLQRMVDEFKSNGGKVTKCPSVEKKGRKITRF